MTAWARIVSQGFYTPSGTLDLHAQADEALRPSLELLPRNLRRGLSELTRSVLSASAGALAGLDSGAQVPAVFASRYGEIQTAVELMRRALEEGDSSPARFRHSVQNTCLGLLSVARADRAPNTTVTAGDETLAMALLETFMQLADGAPRVLVVVADEPVPEELGDNPLGTGGAAAWLLEPTPATPTPEGEPGLYLSRPEPVSSDATTERAEPLALALDLVGRVQTGKHGRVSLAVTPARTWVASLAPAVLPKSLP